MASKLAVAVGVVTGGLDGEGPYGPAKARALLRLAAEIGADLTRSSGYGDHHANISSLRLVGEPHAVAPDAQLYAAASRAGSRIVKC